MNNIKEQARQEATEDCRYAKSLGLIALSQHIHIWTDERYKEVCGRDNITDLIFDHEYELAIREIASKLDTPDCLLGEVK